MHFQAFILLYNVKLSSSAFEAKARMMWLKTQVIMDKKLLSVRL